jgi:endonuclease/exonuclease/phosphatase family metal-dependent hydrolase
MARTKRLTAPRTTCQVGILTWNVENLFHPETGGPRYDYTPREGWTEARYRGKVHRLARALSTIIQRTGRHTSWLFGLTEVENPQVVNDLLAQLPERFVMAMDTSFPYAYHDAVILYDSDFFTLERCTSHATFRRHDRGDVVQADFLLGQQQSRLSVFCCHLKARPDNQYYTAMYRQAVCDNLQNLVWRLHHGPLVQEQIRHLPPEAPRPPGLVLDQHIVLMGDFNDEPFSPSLTEYLRATYDLDYVATQQDVDKVALYNCAWEGLRGQRPGSLYYERALTTKWSMLDQIIISPRLLHADSAVRYVPASFAVVQDLSADANGRPLSCALYNDNGTLQWCDGYSDHFPVWITLEGDI